MHKKHLLLILLILSFAAFIPSALASVEQNDIVDPFVVTIYNERNGLPTGEANDILQTSDGYIWIASYGGLLRYDGSTFRNYSAEGILETTAVRSLYEDSAGRLWIGTNNKGAYYMENNEIHSVTNLMGKGFLTIRDFDEGTDGTIYVASNSGMASIRNGELSPFEGEYVLGETVYTVGVDNHGRVWGALNSGMCIITENGKFTQLIDPNSFFENEVITCVTSDKNGNIYLGSSGNMLARISLPTKSQELADMVVEYIVTDGVTYINNICITGDNRIIVCGERGLCVLDSNGNPLTFGEDQSAVSVSSAIIDYEDDIWLASYSSGIIKYTAGYFRTPNDQAGLGNTPVDAILKLEGVCYVAADGGLLAFDENWHPVHNALTELYAQSRVFSLIKDRNGNVWAAAMAYGVPAVTRYDPSTDSLTTYDEANGLIDTRARVLFELSNGDIAVGTRAGLSVIRDGEVVQSLGVNDGLEVSSILCLMETPDGRILAGTDGGGVYAIDGTIVVQHNESEGLDENAVQRIIQNPYEGGYFVSAGNSLYYHDVESYHLLSNIEKGSGSVIDMYLRNGMLWILQNDGVLAYDRTAVLSGEYCFPRKYTYGHGLTGSLVSNTRNFIDEDGSLWISTRNGISVFDFRLASNPLPKGIIEAVTVDGERLASPEELNLKAFVDLVTIDFAALSFTDTTYIGMSYCMEGHDKEPTTLVGEKSGSVSYANLPGGDYNFVLSIFDPSNLKTRVSYTMHVSKVKNILERPFLLLLLTVLALATSGGIVAIFMRMKIRRIQKRQKEYRGIVVESLHTLARVIDAKDPYTNGHSLRVAQYSRDVAKEMGKSEEEQENIYFIALLHDIGKVGIPDSILNKPGRLTDEEFQIMRRHPIIGGEILEDFTSLSGIAYGAKYHHERFDGKGFCEGIKGLEIPEVARVIAIADAYDAMTSDRCYRPGLSREVAIEELKKNSGTQFDPEIVPFMLKMLEEMDAGKK